MNKSRYIIGIDLGTTNSTLSYIDTAGDMDTIQTFTIPQLTDEGIVKDLPALPSFLYLPGSHEISQKAMALPWDEAAGHITGEYARIQGARIPARLVSSAKSWLCHNRIDREGPVLPRGGDDSVKKISPVEASARYLRHLKDAWNFSMAGGNKGSRLETQQVIITIPASFDESARELTVKAAHAAGIHEFTMLEEPQAAFYAWLSQHRDNWQDLVGGCRLILVFDVGGGTTDFTLISVQERAGLPSLDRVAVGDHIMLGGDNMDLTIARNMENLLTGRSGKFDFHQWLSATHQCREAKEQLLGNSTMESVSISVLGRGRSVIGRAMKAELTSTSVHSTILEGFFKNVDPLAAPQDKRASGLQELGLPFESDTAIMKHLASFLRRHSSNRDLPLASGMRGGIDIVRPDAILFNGGVFKPRRIRDHAAGIISEWFNAPHGLRILENDRFDQAVSIGAARYGQVIRGDGERISGGSGKAYYIEVKTAVENSGASDQQLSVA